nr:RNA-dependent RNA polymerase [Magnaporthe oryzae RNA virus]
MRTACPTSFVGMWVPAVHADCPHNQVASLLKRTLGPVPDPVHEAVGPSVKAVFTRLRSLAARSGVSRWSLRQTAESYKGSLGRRYMEAERSLRVDGPVNSGDTYLRPFLKAEKIKVMDKQSKPRMIFPRSPRYNLSIASRLKPFEHWVWGRLTTRTVLGTGVGRVVAKGLNPRQRANLIVRKFNALDDCVCVEVDGKAFEAHVGKDQILEEHGVYEAAFPGDWELRRLLRVQLSLRGKLPCGAEFERPGGRASGDFNTGMGNSLIMLAVVGAVMKELAPGAFDLLVDGDNALVFMPRGLLGFVRANFERRVLEVSGHEIQLDSPCSVIEQIRFGQSAPINLGGSRGWTMVRDPRKVISQALSSHRWLREPTFATEWIRGVAACELSLSRGVPVLQAWAASLQRVYGGPGGVREHPHTDYFYQGAWFADGSQSVEVTQQARISFCAAFGIAPDEQLALEGGVFDPSSEEYERVVLTSFQWRDLPPGVAEPLMDSL